MESLIYAMDFDHTFTADPGTHAAMVRLLTDAGHRVVCVTARSPDDIDDINDTFEVFACQMPIFATDYGSKLDYMAAKGIKVDIWMDDNPRVLVHGV